MSDFFSSSSFVLLRSFGCIPPPSAPTGLKSVGKLFSLSSWTIFFVTEETKVLFSYLSFCFFLLTVGSRVHHSNAFVIDKGEGRVYMMDVLMYDLLVLSPSLSLSIHLFSFYLPCLALLFKKLQASIQIVLYKQLTTTVLSLSSPFRRYPPTPSRR